MQVVLFCDFSQLYVYIFAEPRHEQQKVCINTFYVTRIPLLRK